MMIVMGGYETRGKGSEDTYHDFTVIMQFKEQPTLLDKHKYGEESFCQASFPVAFQILEEDWRSSCYV